VSLLSSKNAFSSRVMQKKFDGWGGGELNPRGRSRGSVLESQIVLSFEKRSPYKEKGEASYESGQKKASS